MNKYEWANQWLVIDLSKYNSLWDRLKQIFRFIFIGKMEFKLGETQ
jgi:hypothetical protein